MKNILILSAFSSLLLLSCGKPGSDDNGQVRLIDANTILSHDKKWNSKEIIVTFIDGSPELKAEVELYAKEWTKYANLDFKFYKDPSKLPWLKDPDILITFNGKGNTSHVGTDSRIASSGKNPSMNFSGLEKKFSHVRRFIILHELGHALGLQHEHQHPERYFRLDGEEALEYCKKNYSLGEEGCKSHFIKTYDAKEDSVTISKYDPLSIMHYSVHPDAFTKDADSRENLTLSLLDKIEIASLYPGRMKPKKIIEEHLSMENETAKLTTHINCLIKERMKDVTRYNERGGTFKTQVKTYGVESLTENEFSNGLYWEHKSAVIFYMKSIPYCNYSPDELETFRLKVADERNMNKQHGNCVISIDEKGQPINKACSDPKLNAPFEVRKIGSEDLALNFCFASYDLANKAQKEAPYCNLSTEELARLKNEEKQKSRAGTCSIYDNRKIKSRKGCPPSKPFFIGIGEKNSSNKCYATSSEASIALRTNMCN